MLRQKQFKTRIFILSIIGIIISAMTMGANAQDSQETIALAFSPQVLELSANAGDSITNEIRLDNLSDGEVVIDVTPKNFSPQGEEGEVTLTDEDTSFSLADWISVVPKTATLAGRSSQDFTIQINVPNNAEPGGHFGSVVFKTRPPQDQPGAATVSQEVAPIILVAVAGDIVQNAELVEFTASKNFWSNEKPITLDTRVRNTGNVHFKPKGEITIKNMFGSEVTTIDLDEKNVLPDSIRKLTTEWGDPGFAIGRYTADLTLVYGEDNTILTASSTFIVFPYQTVVPAAALIGVLLYILIRFRKRISEAAKVLSGKS